MVNIHAEVERRLQVSKKSGFLADVGERLVFTTEPTTGVTMIDSKKLRPGTILRYGTFMQIKIVQAARVSDDSIKIDFIDLENGPNAPVSHGEISVHGDWKIVNRTQEDLP